MAVSLEIWERGVEYCARGVKHWEGVQEWSRWRGQPQLDEMRSRKRKGYPEGSIFRILILQLDRLNQLHILISGSRGAEILAGEIEDFAVALVHRLIEVKGKWMIQMRRE